MTMKKQKSPFAGADSLIFSCPSISIPLFLAVCSGFDRVEGVNFVGVHAWERKNCILLGHSDRSNHDLE
jgi:hypothetical protein